MVSKLAFCTTIQQLVNHDTQLILLITGHKNSLARILKERELPTKAIIEILDSIQYEGITFFCANSDHDNPKYARRRPTIMDKISMAACTFSHITLPTSSGNYRIKTAQDHIMMRNYSTTNKLSSVCRSKDICHLFCYLGLYLQSVKLMTMLYILFFFLREI